MNRPPDARNPAGAGGARETDHARKLIDPPNSRSDHFPQDLDQPGHLAEVAGAWRAWLPSGILLGAFASRAEAAAALREAVGESPEDHGRPRVLDIYDDRRGRLGRLGHVCVGRSIRAVDPYGVELGTFSTIEAARVAIVAAARAAEAKL